MQRTRSAISHDMGYKSQFAVPKQIVRNYSRLAGLLELADEQFVYIRDYMCHYTQEVKQKIAKNQCEELKIDIITLREYMDRNINIQGLLTELAAICGAEINDVNPEMYIHPLAWLDKTTLGDLHVLLDNNREVALKLARRALEGSELDILSSTVGLRFLCQAELLRQGASEDCIVEFLILSGTKKERAQRQAKALLRSGAAIQREFIRIPDKKLHRLARICFA